MEGAPFQALARGIPTVLLKPCKRCPLHVTAPSELLSTVCIIAQTGIAAANPKVHRRTASGRRVPAGLSGHANLE